MRATSTFPFHFHFHVLDAPALEEYIREMPNEIVIPEKAERMGE